MNVSRVTGSPIKRAANVRKSFLPNPVQVAKDVTQQAINEGSKQSNKVGDVLKSNEKVASGELKKQGKVVGETLGKVGKSTVTTVKREGSKAKKTTLDQIKVMNEQTNTAFGKLKKIEGKGTGRMTDFVRANARKTDSGPISKNGGLPRISNHDVQRELRIPRISNKDVIREGKEAGGIASKVGKAFLRGFAGSGTNSEGAQGSGGRSTVNSDEKSPNDDNNNEGNDSDAFRKSGGVPKDEEVIGDDEDTPAAEPVQVTGGYLTGSKNSKFRSASQRKSSSNAPLVIRRRKISQK